MDRVGRLLLAVLLILASACTVQGRKTGYSASWCEFRPNSTYSLIFTGGKMPGWAYHSDEIRSTVGCNIVGSMGGMGWYHSPTDLEMVLTVTFNQNPKSQMFKGSAFYLRGQWRANGTLPDRQLSIVGGQGGLKFAKGSATYTPQSKPGTSYLVHCDFYLEDYYNIPTTHVDLVSLYRNSTELAHDSPGTTDDVQKQVDGSP